MISIPFHRFIKDVEAKILRLLAANSAVCLRDLCKQFGCSTKGTPSKILAAVLTSLLQQRKIIGPDIPYLVTNYYVPRVSPLTKDSPSPVRLAAYIGDYLTRCGAESFEDDIRAAVVRIYAVALPHGELHVEVLERYLGFMYGNSKQWKLELIEAKLQKYCANPNVRKFLYGKKIRACDITNEQLASGA